VREAAPWAVLVLGFLWILAVSFGILARLTKLTKRHDWLGSVARFCSTVEFLSP
jgi:hypothetical protein